MKQFGINISFLLNLPPVSGSKIYYSYNENVSFYYFLIDKLYRLCYLYLPYGFHSQ